MMRSLISKDLRLIDIPRFVLLLLEFPFHLAMCLAQSSKFVMRAQLDCQDSRLPGTGVFDIKTRAVLPIRIDQLNYQVYYGPVHMSFTDIECAPRKTRAT
jgi:hypothetical protein